MNAPRIDGGARRVHFHMMTTISKPTFGETSWSTARWLQKELPKFIKVRPRTAIECAPSLARPLSHALSEASQTDRECYLARHMRASTLGGYAERAMAVLLWPRQRAAMGVTPTEASRSHRSRVAHVHIGRVPRQPADGF